GSADVRCSGYFAPDRHPCRGCKIEPMQMDTKAATERLERQIDFLLEIDKLKTILRRTYLLHADRSENTAEHSWHLALTAMILSEYANEPVDVAHVIKMVLIHDIVEIDAGDTYLYDA